MKDLYLIKLVKEKYMLLMRSVYYELKCMYAGSVLGLFWVFIGPIILVVAYSVIYLYVLKVKPAGMSGLNYVNYVVSGLIPYMGVVQSAQKSASSIVINKAVIFNTLYPVEFIPLRAVVSVNITTLIGILLILGYKLVTFSLGFASIFVFFYFANMLLFLSGISLMLSLVTVVLRDVENILQYLFMFFLFITPIGFFPESLPPALRLMVYLNPIYYLIRPFQEILAYGQLPSFTITVCTFAMSIFTFFVGSRFFRTFKMVAFEFI